MPPQPTIVQYSSVWGGLNEASSCLFAGAFPHQRPRGSELVNNNDLLTLG